MELSLEMELQSCSERNSPFLGTGGQAGRAEGGSGVWWVCPGGANTSPHIPWDISPARITLGLSLDLSHSRYPRCALGGFWGGKVWDSQG